MAMRVVSEASDQQWSLEEPKIPRPKRKIHGKILRKILQNATHLLGNKVYLFSKTSKTRIASFR